eukprot:100402_1
MQYGAWVEMLKHDGKKKNEDPPPVPRHLFKRDQAYSPNFVIPVPQENWVVPSDEALAKAGVIRVEPGDDQNENGLSTREKVVYGLLASLGLALISALALFLGGFFDSAIVCTPPTAPANSKFVETNTHTSNTLNAFESILTVTCLRGYKLVVSDTNEKDTT